MAVRAAWRGARRAAATNTACPPRARWQVRHVTSGDGEVEPSVMDAEEQRELRSVLSGSSIPPPPRARGSAGRGGGGMADDTVEADLAAAEERLERATNDDAVRWLFRKYRGGQKYAAITAAYGRWAQAYGWNFARPQVELTTTAMNLVLDALVREGGTVAIGVDALREVTRIVRRMERTRGVACPPDGETYGVYLTAVAHANVAQNTRAVAEVERVLGEVARRRLDMTPAAYEAALGIMNAWQVDTKPLWLRMAGQGVPLTFHMTRHLIDSAILHRDAGQAVAVVQAAVRARGGGVTQAVAARALRVLVDNFASPALFTALLTALRGVEKPERIRFTAAAVHQALVYLSTQCEGAEAGAAVEMLRAMSAGTGAGVEGGADGLYALSAARHASDREAFLDVFAGPARRLREGELPFRVEGVDWFQEAVAALCTDDAAARGLARACAERAAALRQSGEAVDVPAPDDTRRRRGASTAANEAAAYVMCGAAALTHVGLTDAAMGYVEDHAGGMGAYVAVLSGFASRPYERHHEVLLGRMREGGVEPSAACYDVCVRLSCQGDDLDSALRWVAALTEAHPLVPPSKDALGHLLYAACRVGDVALAVGVVQECGRHRAGLARELREAAVGALRAVDWRGTGVAKVEAALGEYDAAVVAGNRTAMEAAVERWTRGQEARPRGGAAAA